MKPKLLISFLLIFTIPILIQAGTVGKIRGIVTDLQTGEALIGANVLVVGTSLGAATDVNGEYIIQNITAGTYEVRASFIGYQTITISNMRVNADLTTELNFELPAEGVQVQEITVIAAKPLINKNATNANRITTGEDIDALPVRGVDNILSLTPGVVLQDNTLFIRGGRQDEVGFYLEGASISDPVVGGRAVTIAQDAVEELQVQAGGYTAEYGGANAGIIYTQIKSGTPEYKASYEYITDNVGFKSRNDRYSGDEVLGTNWYGYSEMIATLSGPIVDKRFKFFGLFNYNYQNDQNPQPFPGINLGLIGDATTHDTINLVYPAGSLFKNSLETLTGTGSISLDFNPLLFRIVGTYTRQNTFNPFSSSRVAGNIANMFNQDRIEKLDFSDGSISLKVTHIINPSTFYEISGGYSFNNFDRYDPILEDNFMSYGDSIANANAGVLWARDEGDNIGRFQRPARINIFTFSFNAPGDVIAGYQKSKRERLNFAAALTSQIGKEHSIKIGGELQLLTIRNFSFGNEALMALSGLVFQNDQIPAGDPNKITTEQVIIGRGINNYGYDVFGNEIDEGEFIGPKKPVMAAGYIQDKIEYKDLIVNAGVRFDYIDIDNKEFVDPTRPELSINYNTGELIPSGFGDVPKFMSISPRLGFSFPVTDQTVFHAQYGKFVQQTRLRDVYQGIYATSYNLRGGFEITAPVGFNIRPTRTTQYEIGFTQQLADFASFDVTGFYKDIQDQVVFDKIDTNPTSPFKSYNLLINGDFATTKGIEFSFNMRRIQRFQVNASLSFQDARGTGSFPNSARGIVGAPLDGVTIFKPQYVSPLEYNNSFRGNINLDYRFGNDESINILRNFGVSALLTFNSGHPYTTGIGGADLEGDARDRQPIEPLNASTTPWVYQLDLRIDKSFGIIDRLSANIYVWIINVFDTKNIQNVFLRTGSTEDDGYLTDPNLGGILVETLGQKYADMYRAVNIDYYEQWQVATTGAPYTTAPFFFGPPRQIRLGIRLEY